MAPQSRSRHSSGNGRHLPLPVARLHARYRLRSSVCSSIGDPFRLVRLVCVSRRGNVEQLGMFTRNAYQCSIKMLHHLRYECSCSTVNPPYILCLPAGSKSKSTIHHVALASWNVPLGMGSNEKSCHRSVFCHAECLHRGIIFPHFPTWLQHLFMC